jgi:hypothetical protein
MHFIAFEIAGAILVCIPPAHLWNPTVPGYCLNVQAVGRAFVATNMITDISILLLPLPLIWKLHLSRRQKIQLTVLFTLGGV